MAVAPGRITHRSVKRRLDAGAKVIIGFDTEYESATNEDVQLPDKLPGNHVLCISFTVPIPEGAGGAPTRETAPKR